MNTAYQVGDVVRYSDIYNNETFIVIAHHSHDHFNPYTLRNTTTYEVTRSDMNQRGWSLITR